MLRTLLMILLCCSSQPIFAALQTQLDKANVVVDETLILTITSTDHLRLSPDLEPLKNDFYIMGTSQNSQINIINGSTHIETQWQIALMPKHSGDLQIPALHAGSDQTQPQLVHVVAVAKESSALNASNSSDIFIEVNVIPKESFVQEQFIYTLKVYFARSIENGYLEPPTMSDAKIIQNGQDILYTSTKKGKFYRVLERSYLITSQKVGHFLIEPPALRGYMPNSPGVVDLYGFSNQSVKPIKISGSPVEVNIKPKPANFAGQWLPAKNVTLSESWEPAPPTFRAGEPVTRLIEVTAEGATGEQIPTVQVTSKPGFNVYPQQPSRDSSASNGIPVGKLQQKVVYIPTQPGYLILPAIKVHWWNTKTRHDAFATLPSRSVKVLPPVNPVTQPAATVAPNQIKPAAIPGDESNPASKATNRKSYVWPLLTLVSILAWLITLWMWRRQSKGPRLNNKRKPLTLKECYNPLKAASLSGNPSQTRALFLTWAKLYWPEVAIHSLADVTVRLEDTNSASLTAEIMRLESVFYSDHQQLWQGAAFWEALDQWLKTQEENINPNQKDPLPPLYCTLGQ